MHTGSPKASRVVTMVLFALSCIGLLLFLWLSFGGTIPFETQGYRFQVAFQNAYDLADQADVRIAGVSVGKVVSKQLDTKASGTLVTIQLNNKYAPIHRNATAILREKTLLGETYVQLSPGTKGSPALPDNGTLNVSQVIPAVQLDQIFNTFDPTTRAAFRSWQQSLATAIKGNDQNLSDVLGNLPTFAVNLTQLLQVLDIEHSSVVQLVQNGGTTFAALNRDPAALQNLIRAGETTFHTTAANNNSLADIFHILPTFENEQKQTMAQLQSFSQNADPVIKGLIPVAEQLGPTLKSVNQLSPSLRHLFVQLDPLVTAANKGLPATEAVLEGAQPERAARPARPVPRAAQPDPCLARRPPAADLRLHLRRRPGLLRPDGDVRRQRHRPLPAPVRSGRPRVACDRAEPECGQPRQRLPVAAVAARRRPSAERLQVREPAGMGLQERRRWHRTGPVHARQLRPARDAVVLGAADAARRARSVPGAARQRG